MSLKNIVKANNRQLHPDEKALAKKLTENSKGKWTATQIEEQMRGMSMTKNGVTEAGSPDTIVGTQLGDGKWMKAGTTADGQPIFTQQIAPADAELRAYIVGNTTNSAVPSLITYAGSSDYAAQSTSNSLPIPTVTCGAMDMYCASGVQRPMTPDQLEAQRNNGADFVSYVSTQAARFGATAAAVGAVSGPHTPVAEGTAFVAAVLGLGTSGLEQLLRPNVGQVFIDGTASAFSLAADKLPGGPLFSPITNEVLEILKNTQPIGQAQNWINDGQKK